MPLDATKAATMTDALIAAFADIGYANGTSMPRSKNPKDAAAWRYFVSSTGVRCLEADREKAKREAIAAGVLPDYRANPFPIGTSETVYSSALLAIGLKVVGQADRVNIGALVADLEAAGVKPALLKKLVAKNTERFPGAHVFSASLATG